MIDTIDSPYIHVATADTFQSLVLENSKTGPVLANFWSKKAGPCLRQYPILDALVAKYQGKFLLINIDTNQEIKISREYGITSVPTLKLFRNEKEQVTLHGYQNEADPNLMLDQYVSRDSDQVLASAIKEYTIGNHNEAYEIITGEILNDPENPRLPVALCKLLNHEGRYSEATNLLNSVPPDIGKNPDIILLQDQLYFLVTADQINDVDALIKHEKISTNDLDAKIQLCSHYVANKQFKEGLQELAKIIEIDPKYKQDYACSAMLKVFNILGQGHELIAEFRLLLNRYKH